MVLSEEAFIFFAALEKALKTVVAGIGGISHDDYRAFHNDRRSGSARSTIDGDLIETFLELSKEDMETVVVRLNNDSRSKAVEPKPGPGAARASTSGDSSSTYAAPSILLTLEEVLSRVEDISRLH